MALITGHDLFRSYKWIKKKREVIIKNCCQVPYLLESSDFLLQLVLSHVRVVFLQSSGWRASSTNLRLQLEQLQHFQLLPQVLDQLQTREMETAE